MDESTGRICVIGAGSSGIAACKALMDERLDFDCFELSDRVGGNWVFKNSNGISSIYRSLHMNTSRTKMEFADFPMPADYPEYPFHEQIAAYCDAYVDHFKFRDRIHFGCGIRAAKRRKDGTWEIELTTGEIRTYGYLVVASGRHWHPRWPSPRYQGSFDGIEMHAHSYIDPTDPHSLQNKSILVVGFGNTALDIACELGRKEQNQIVYLSMRRGYWVVPRFFGKGRTADYNIQHPSKPVSLFKHLWPAALSARQRRKDIIETLGRPEDFGLPPPEKELDFSRAATSQELYNRIGSGDIAIKPDIARLEGRNVRFTDGTTAQVDAIIYATGYEVVFPFFEKGFMPEAESDLIFWKRIVDPRYDNLFFVGIVQPQCAVIPVAEQQGKFVSSLISGRYRLPDKEAIARDCARIPRPARPAEVVTGPYTMQVKCSDYVREITSEIARGTRRALSS
jgi:dimethylaniline monooxygenase (N-oxide forming)